jgi:hypothetical protein
MYKIGRDEEREKGRKRKKKASPGGIEPGTSLSAKLCVTDRPLRLQKNATRCCFYGCQHGSCAFNSRLLENCGRFSRVFDGNVTFVPVLLSVCWLFHPSTHSFFTFSPQSWQTNSVLSNYPRFHTFLWFFLVLVSVFLSYLPFSRILPFSLCSLTYSSSPLLLLSHISSHTKVFAVPASFLFGLFFLFDVSFLLSQYLQPVVFGGINPQTTKVVSLTLSPLRISRLT